MDFFKRITRIAKAELNSLTDRFRQDDDQLQEAFEELGDDDRAAAAKKKASTGFQGTSGGQHWPPEIRQAYAALELPLGAGRDEAKKAYRDMLKRYHPDKHQGDPERAKTATELTRRVREQYELLDGYLMAEGK